MSKLDLVLKQVRLAQEEFAYFSQERVDEIFRAVASVANAHRIELAQMAVEETGMAAGEDACNVGSGRNMLPRTKNAVSSARNARRRKTMQIPPCVACA